MFDDDKPSLDAVMQHHGIKGMKWGVHKKEDVSSGSSGGKASSKTSDAEHLAAVLNLQKKYMAIPPDANKSHGKPPSHWQRTTRSSWTSSSRMAITARRLKSTTA
jgi:hypothetical protein